MKRVFAIIFSFLLLTACTKREVPVTEPEELPEEVIVQEEEMPEEPVIVVEPEIIIHDSAEDTPLEDESVPVSFTSQIVEGLVEDTVGYQFEVPVFDYAGYPAMEQFYAELIASMENFTKEVVYNNAVERGCVVSVYGKAVSATVLDSILSVTYTYECDYSDAEEPTVETRIDRFDIETGARLEN